jgi:hypothetical protein
MPHTAIARTRGAVAAFGALYLVAAFGYYQARNVEVYLPWLWPAWLACAGGACLMFAARLDSAFWWQCSRILVVIGTLSRCASIALRSVYGELPSGWSGFAGSLIYLAAALATFLLWGGSFRFWSRRAAGTTASGA